LAPDSKEYIDREESQVKYWEPNVWT
jgi:hypothetical protein